MPPSIQIHAVGREGLPPLAMPARFRTELPYYITVAGTPGVPPLGPGEYFVRLDDTRRILDDGCLTIVSPLDSAMRAEIELNEDHERWLEWMQTHSVEHIRVV
jgi:hypothetical protein